MSTRFANGKKITTKKNVSNGVETVQIFENDVLVSHTVNGEPQMVGGGGRSPASSAGSNRASPYSRHAHSTRHRHL